MSYQDPARRMQAIREWVRQGSLSDSADFGPVALMPLTDLNKLRDRVADVEARQTLHEQPFVSPVPLIGGLIVRVRSVWNWMSTKWYVRPLVQQQNNFNAFVVQAWTELLLYLKSVALFARTVHTRLDDLESRLDELAKVQMTTRSPSSEPLPSRVNVAGVVEDAAPGWRDLFAAGPVVVLSCGRGEAVRILSEHGLEVSGVESDLALVQQCTENNLNVVHGSNVERLASLPDGKLGGVVAVWHTPASVQDIVRLLDQCRRVLHMGAWAVWVWPWSATSDGANAQAARDMALGMGFRRVRLEADQRIHLASQTLLLQK